MILFVTMAILMAADWGGLHFQEPRPRRTGGETGCRREGLGSLPGRGAYERMLCSRIVIRRSVQQGGDLLPQRMGAEARTCLGLLTWATRGTMTLLSG